MLPEVPKYAETRNKYNMVTSFYHYNVVTARRAVVRFLSFPLIGTGYVRLRLSFTFITMGQEIQTKDQIN